VDDATRTDCLVRLTRKGDATVVELPPSPDTVMDRLVDHGMGGAIDVADRRRLLATVTPEIACGLPAAAPGVALSDLPTPLGAARRLRGPEPPGPERHRGLILFMANDNLRKGASRAGQVKVSRQVIVTIVPWEVWCTSARVPRRWISMRPRPRSAGRGAGGRHSPRSRTTMVTRSPVRPAHSSTGPLPSSR
jgi:hypothetical protein